MHLQVAVVVNTADQSEVVTLVCPSKQEACANNLPDIPCPIDCSTPNGECNTLTGTCKCTAGWEGADCSQFVCTGQECLPDGSEQGEQSQGTCEEGMCQCAEGFTGVDCRVEEPQCTRDCAQLVRCFSVSCSPAVCVGCYAVLWKTLETVASYGMHECHGNPECDVVLEYVFLERVFLDLV